MPNPYDFCVICAKPAESREVLAVFSKKFNPIRGRHLSHQVFSIPCSARELSVFVTTCADMGNMHAAVRTAEVINSHQPHILIFIGTAASLKPDEIQVGDVVVPRTAVWRIYDKITEQGQRDYESRKGTRFAEYFFETNALLATIRTADCTPEAMTAFAGIPIDRIVLEEVQHPQAPNVQTLRRPKIHDDFNIFTCGMVVDSVSYRKFLTSFADENMRKIGIIDMESIGFFSALAATNKTGVGNNTVGLMIRGVSDYAGHKEQTEAIPVSYKEISVRNAAIVATEMIKHLADRETEPEGGVKSA